MTAARQRFQQWIEREYLTNTEISDEESFFARLRRRFSIRSTVETPLPTGQKRPQPKSQMPVVKDQTHEMVDFQFDGCWLTADFCAKEFNLDDTSLSRWALNGCPHLEGRKLRRQKFPPDQSRWCYHRVDIENIDSALNGDD